MTVDPAEPVRARILARGTWGALVGALAVLVAVGAGLLVGARTAADSILSAPRAAELFLTSVAAGDDDWQELLSPALRQRALASGTIPLIGAPVLLDGDVLRLEHESGPAHYVQVEQLTGAVGPDELVDEGAADTALVPVRLSYVVPVAGRSQRFDVSIRLVLSRAFYYDDAAERPGGARPDAAPTAVGPWLVSAVQGDTVPDDVLQDDPADEVETHSDMCATAASVLVDLSDVARIEGRISTRCLADGADVTDVLGTAVDAEQAAAAVPVLTAAAPPAEVLWLPGDEPPMQAFMLTVDDRSHVALIAQVDGRATLVALRAVGAG